MTSADPRFDAAETFIGSILFVLANTMTDIAYSWADPRIRLQ